MAPCRQLLIWSVPSIAVLLGIFWFRRKREFAKSDPGGREKIKSLQEELAEVLKTEAKSEHSMRPDARIIIKSTPINIVQNGSSSQRSSLELTDEEVDIEIEKIIRKKSLEKERKTLSLGSDDTIMREVNKRASTSLTAPACSRYSLTVKENASCSSLEEETEVVASTVIELTGPADPLREHHSQCDSSQHLDADDAPSTATPESAHARVTPLDIPDEINNNEDDKEKNNSTHSENNKCPVEQVRRSSERDSANHSPADAMLASPSMLHFSDNHSEGSSDSGKGCSEAASPPPAAMNLAQSPDSLRIHQFVIPQTLVGLLIGKQGSFVAQVKAKTGANIFVKRHPESIKFKICAVEGTQSEIEAALDMIRRKFPEKKFPHLSLQEISAELYQRLAPLVPEFLQLVESVNNETIMTCLVSAGHFFLQQPLHPTFPSLQALHRLMAATYQCPDVPDLPRPVKEGSICAAPTENNWYRAQVVSTSEETDTSVVKLVDFGGYLTLDNSLLKQIRSDFMTLPFQATEALLAYVKPANGAEEWSGEALRIMAALTAGQLLHAQVAGYDESGVPLTQLYLTVGVQQVIDLNKELVERGLGEWDLPQETAS